MVKLRLISTLTLIYSIFLSVFFSLIFGFAYWEFFPREQGKKIVNISANELNEFKGSSRFDGHSYQLKFKKSEYLVTEINYRDLPISEALHTAQPPAIALTYSYPDLLPFIAPFDPFYFSQRKDVNSLVDNWESRVGVSLSETRFLPDPPFFIDLAGKNRAYFGLIHSHTAESDGMKTPTDAFRTARDVAHLDFFAVTDHPEYWFFQNPQNWIRLQGAAQQMSTPTFVALAGFEYSNTALGHYVVLNSSNYISSITTPGLGGFYSWLAQPEQGKTLVFFAHPGFHRYRQELDFLHFKFSFAAAPQMCGIEVIHHNESDKFLLGYEKKIPYMDEAIAQGWTLGAVASQDNHRENWGIQDSSRIGVLLPFLSKKNLLESFKARHYYATKNENLQFSTNAALRNGEWAQMGDEIDSAQLLNGDLSVVARFAEPDTKDFPQRLEVVVNGKVSGYLRFFEPFEEEPQQPFWNIDGTSQPPEVFHPGITHPQAGEFRFTVPFHFFHPSPGSRASVYVRFYQGKNGHLVTQSSPFFVNF